MATIEKRERKKGVVYQVDVRVAGYPRQKKTFKRLTDAKAWAAKTESDIKSGQFQPISTQSKRKTFSDVIDRYEREVLPNLAESTQRSSGTALRYWRTKLGEYSLQFITTEQVSKLMGELAATPDERGNGEKTKPKSKRTLKYYRDALDMLFKKACSWKWLGVNPMDGVERVTKLRNERTRYLSDDERERLLDACRESPNKQLYPIVVFALSTGCRRGEIMGLTLPDIDLARNMAVLRDTKNGDTRSVPIVGHLAELLDAQIILVNDLYDAQFSHAPRRYLFPRRDLAAQMDVRKAWENAVAKAKITNFRFHDLRHSTASYLAMQGKSLIEIADMLGHKTLQMVKRYSHLSADHKKGLAEELDGKMF